MKSRYVPRFRLRHVLLGVLVIAIVMAFLRSQYIENQSIVLRGKIVDESGNPVPNAKVTVAVTSDHRTIHTHLPMSTDSNGHCKQGQFGYGECRRGADGKFYTSFEIVVEHDDYPRTPVTLDVMCGEHPHDFAVMLRKPRELRIGEQ